jgi:Uma2 family endonuclease
MAIAERELLSSSDTVKPYCWTREQFYQMGDAGLLRERRIELVDGEIIQLPPIGPAHQSINTIIADKLRSIFGVGFFVREQGPFSIGTANDLLPDIAVIEGSPRDYLTEHPKAAALIVEVSDTTLEYDRSVKANLYAVAAVLDYWIINVREDQVEIYRKPELTPTGVYRYHDVHSYHQDETVTPLARAEMNIAVADLLP